VEFCRGGNLICSLWVKSSASVYVIQRNSCSDVQGPAGLMLPIVELNILFSQGM
jgi:hypothetical protein